MYRFLPIIILISFSGCASYKREITNTSSLYKVIPRYSSQIHWYDVGHWSTWMLFGNEDDGIFGEDSAIPFRQDLPASFEKAIRWWLRNPLHNFTFYTIGSADRINSEFTIVYLESKSVSFFNYRSEGTLITEEPISSFFLGFHGGKPFIFLRLGLSSNRYFITYLGWRERGNFGFKLHPFAHRSIKNSSN